jgi:hypothetical protein
MDIASIMEAMARRSLPKEALPPHVSAEYLDDRKEFISIPPVDDIMTS